MWRGQIAIHLHPMSGEMERRSQKVLKPQFRGHGQREDRVDLVALRDFYCDEIIEDVEGLTKDGQPFGKTAAERRLLWDGTPDFRTFVIQAASDAANFGAEKNG
jgi:hypothetical protein